MTSNTKKENGKDSRRPIRVKLTHRNTMAIDFRGLPGEAFQTNLEIAGYPPTPAPSHSEGEGLIQGVERFLQSTNQNPTVTPESSSTELNSQATTSQAFGGGGTSSGAAKVRNVQQIGPFHILSANPIVVEPIPDNLEQTPDNFGMERQRQILNENHDLQNFAPHLIRFVSTLVANVPGISLEATDQALIAFTNHVKGAVDRMRNLDED